MRSWLFFCLALLFGCFSSQLRGESDADAIFDASVDSPLTDTGSTHDGIGLGSDSEIDGGDGDDALRNTFLLLRNWAIEERRLDDPAVLVDIQELPERLGRSGIREDHVTLLAATDHGFLFQYNNNINSRLYVFDRRRGWSMHDLPEPQLIVHQAVIRNGWLYPTAGDADDRQIYRFHIEDGRFEEVDLDPDFLATFDGLDGHVITFTAPMWAWEFDTAQQLFVKLSSEPGETFPYDYWPSRRMLATLDGALPFCRFGMQPGGLNRWALLRPDENFVYRTTQEALRPAANGNIVSTANGNILFFDAYDRGGRWEEREADITLYQMDTSFENLEVLLEGRFGWPVEIALGDTVERVVAATR